MQPLQKEWQVEVLGQVYTANFDELKQWIAEGAVMPNDRVKRGELRWIAAIKVKDLADLFGSQEPIDQDSSQAAGFSDFFANEEVDWGLYLEKVCHLHKERDYAYACDVCKHYFCTACPKTYGTVRICPLCDALCRSVDEPLNFNKSVGAVNKPYQRSDKTEKKSRLDIFRLKNLKEVFDYSVKYIKSAAKEAQVSALTPNKQRGKR